VDLESRSKERREKAVGDEALKKKTQETAKKLFGKGINMIIVL